MVRRLTAHMQTGRFHDADEVTKKPWMPSTMSRGIADDRDRCCGAGGITGLALSGHRSNAARVRLTNLRDVAL